MAEDPAPAPLIVLAGAPGAGKSTLAPMLVRSGGGLVVMDMDELLEDGALLGIPIAHPDAEPIWPAYNRMWDRIVAMVRRSGHPVLLLSPTPSPGELEADNVCAAPVRWALLDCDDELRRERLEARHWPREWVADALEDARQTRLFAPAVIASDNGSSERVVNEILDWVRRALM
ncbi:MAG: AAA family ATPase [Mycobacteriales bacterium]